ncbi:MAG: 5-formyltetrahydrofolate cyclo-ligase [Treponema sp.]|uniref:5-formyltetrahydrofolate cyclo-ligase n=1 Tax=Treponema sp. TaxID=166 RepID=UPI0025D756F6|nr:5-formyltetrahydrofolate cyclo-ligase [Treponema sp.]MBQ8678947.1 5-formyltetrahydrofolate cyclo-ligase [Treponema sp.]
MDGENTRDFKKILRKEMKQTLTLFHANLSEREKDSLTENLTEKITVLAEYKNSPLILAYIPDKLEADCRPVISDALKKGKKVAVPKVDFEALKDGRSEMNFYFLEEGKSLEDQLEAGAYGILEPKADLKKLVWGLAGQKAGEGCPAEGVAENRKAGWSEGETSPFMLVPGVAFTKDGKRLGHGKGFYDIFIEKLQKAGLKPYLCALALPCQIVTDLATDKHDILMDRVIF